MPGSFLRQWLRSLFVRSDHLDFVRLDKVWVKQELEFVLPRRRVRGNDKLYQPAPSSTIVYMQRLSLPS